ncbi:MAG: TetR/AcrR family transcriptional regulator [Rickettsiales bacterium]|nr:TetR/AcrR family transcriptional regulator [Rickettsiales bacterium]
MGRKRLDPTTSAKRALILKTAGKMFVRHGYAGVSMDAIADAVPVSKRTLYNHFNDKKALFTAVMHARCLQVSHMLEQNLSAERDPADVLTEIANLYMDIVLEPEAVDMYRTLITESHQFPELGKLFYESGPMRAGGLLAEYLRRTDAKKQLSVPNPEIAAGLFIGMLLNRAQMQWLLGVRRHMPAVEKQELVHYAVEIFLRGHGRAA